MDLESDLSVVESVEDNGEIENVTSPRNLSESKVQNNGSYIVEKDDCLLSYEIKGNGTEVLGSVNSLPLEMKPELLPSPSETRKGRGLRKWRRIKRDVSKVRESSIDSDKRDLSTSGVSSSKRPVYAERNQNSEGTASSTNAIVRNLDGCALVRDLETSFAADTDSDNSEDRSSKSSTAASAPKIKQETLVGVFSDDKSRRTSFEKNFIHSIQPAQQRKGWSETSKKARGERIKIEKENSHSSVESDLRSSNFVFMQGTCSTSNRMQSERPLDSDGENGDEVQCSEREVSDGVQSGYVRNSVGVYEDTSHDVVAESSWDVKEERSNNHDSSVDGDPLSESMSGLQSLQEALEKEVLMCKEIKDVPVDDSIPDTPADEGIQNSSQAVKSEVVHVVNREAETELEEIIKQKIEAEVEYLILSRAIQQQRPVAAHQPTVSEELKVTASEQSQVLHKLEASVNKAQKVENINDVIAIADETLQLQKRVCKYTSCFFVQLVLLIVILGVFILQLSADYTEVVPT